MLEINQIHYGDSSVLLKQINDNIIDLTVTSPPYDNLRDYKGYTFNFEEIAKELFRVTKKGGVVVWVVGDATINGSETGTSFRQALYFKKVGFNIHDTMIFSKTIWIPQFKFGRYTNSFEYMFVFSKGKPKTTNLIEVDCKYAGKIIKRTATNNQNVDKGYSGITKDKKIKNNVWEYKITGTNYGHPAIFPEKLAEDHILSWSNEGDVVLDPLCGSGTTCKMAKRHNRKFIGIDISKEYCEIANKRLSQEAELFKKGS